MATVGGGDANKANAPIINNVSEINSLTVPLSSSQGGTGTATDPNTPNGIVTLDALGRLPVADGSQLQNITRQWTIINHTDDKVFSAADMFRIHTNQGTGRALKFTLPRSTLVLGQEIQLVKLSNFQIEIKADSLDKILDSSRGGNLVSTTTDIGIFIKLTALSGHWIGSGFGVFTADFNTVA